MKCRSILVLKQLTGFFPKINVSAVIKNCSFNFQNISKIQNTSGFYNRTSKQASCLIRSQKWNKNIVIEKMGIIDKKYTMVQEHSTTFTSALFLGAFFFEEEFNVICSQIQKIEFRYKPNQYLHLKFVFILKYVWFRVLH